MSQLGPIWSGTLSQILVIRWLAKVGFAFALCLLISIMADVNVLASIKFENRTPAPDSIITDTQPVIKYRVKYSGDLEFSGIPPYFWVKISGCPGTREPHTYFYSDPGVDEYNHDSKNVLGVDRLGAYSVKVDLKEAGCTLSEGEVTVEAYAQGQNASGGSFSKTEQWTFTVLILPPVEINSISPTSGPPGTEVTLMGRGFQGSLGPLTIRRLGSQLLFDGQNIAFTLISSTQIKFSAPPSKPCGSYNVQVRNVSTLGAEVALSNMVAFTVSQPCNSGGSSPPGAGNQAPAADFSFSPANPGTAQPVQFTDQSSDPDGASDITVWSWNFGDGAISANQNPSHSFSSPGTYSVKLVVTDSAGLTSSATKSITVASAPPPSGASPGDFDTNNNNQLDDLEFFAAVDAWIAGNLDNTIFFMIVDAWIGQSPVSASSLRGFFNKAPHGISALGQKNVITFQVFDSRVISMSVELFGLDGARIYSGSGAGSSLSLPLIKTDGYAPASGVYLYRVVARGSGGAVLYHQISKLLVMR